MSQRILLLALVGVAMISPSAPVVIVPINIPKSSPPTVFCYDNADCNEASGFWAGACKSGTKQSPIDLPIPLPLFPLFTRLFNPVRPLSFNGNYHANSFYIIDNGHTIQIQLGPTATSSAEMTGYELTEPYVFAQAHIHWGLPAGSEHSIGGMHKSGEIHLVHYKKSYGSVAAAAAANDPKGIAVVGVLLEKSLVPSFRGMAALQPIAANVLQNRIYSTAPRQVNAPIDLGLFLPHSGEMVYRYEGSLTTPNCTEAVLWTVARYPMTVPALDMLVLETVTDEEGKPLLRNNRATQPLNGRSIEVFTVQ